jgi:transcriptional regulator of acetoin/glycerol metabolism
MRAEAINFAEGASWEEGHAGTNAPGTALRLDTAVQIHGSEHFARAVQQWACAAAPIHDPETQTILGVVDVTGGPDVNSPQTLAMVRAAARMAEAEMGRLKLVGLRNGLVVPARAHPPRLVLEGLGRADCQLDDGGRVLRLSRRHSEILTILADYPDGLTSEQLAVELYDDDAALSTVRAEMTRVRSLLGEAVVDSRPYRLRVPVQADWRTVQDHLTAGRLADAMRTYRGPLLPQSDAPGIVARRERLAGQLRHAVLHAGNVDLMIAWTRARWGADDLEMWEQEHRLLPSGSPLRSIAAAEIARLNAEYGIPALRVPGTRALSRG